MSLLIEKSGILDSVQALAASVFAVSGSIQPALSTPAAGRLINILLGNPESEGVLEFHFPAPEINFESDTLFALGGAHFSAHLDGEPIDNWRPIIAQKNSLLTFKNKLSGSRVYLAVKGGFKIEKWLGSVSTNLAAGLGGFEGRKLKTGDRISFRSNEVAEFKRKCRISPSIIPRYSRFPTVRITAGAEYGLLNALGQETLLKDNFAVTAQFRPDGLPARGQAYFSEREDRVDLVRGKFRYDPAFAGRPTDRADGRSSNIGWLSSHRARRLGRPASARPARHKR